MATGLYSRKQKQVDSPAGPDRKKARFLGLRSPYRLILPFLLHAAKGLLPFQYDLKPVKKSAYRGPFKKEFFGVGVAEPKDSSACERALGLVEDLGVGAVRFDLTYGQDSSQVDALIDGLHSRGIDVLLHLVQPIEAALRMPEASAVNEWRDFMRASLDRFSGKIVSVEIGTTINRAKWSGLSLEGFLALWESSHAIAREKDVRLVGPNVTDFEPQYNAGILALLAHRDLLPDVHSNNLFAERAIEPEDYDRKILGPSLSRLHGFDLRKKIRLIAAISRKRGIERNWSTSAFWTLPRIDRWLARPEEQMADYLARYYVLCASEGSFERIYWGPLLSFREGLVDDGTFLRSDDDPSARDVVSYYDVMKGDSQTWRRRPAYGAMRTLCSELTGATHEMSYSLKPGNGLQAHAFKKDDRSIYVLWTQNGLFARLSDCFSPEAIESVDYALDRDGNRLPEGACFFGQSPVYLIWPQGFRPEFKASAAPIPDLVVAPAEHDFDYYDFDEGEWRGLIRAESQKDAQLLADALSPEAIGQRPEKGTLRKARNAIWTVEDPRVRGRLLVVKKPVRMAWHKRILDRRKPSKALRSWNGTSELMRRGINTPKVVAYFESKKADDLMNNWFICEHFESRLSVRSFFGQYAEGAIEVEGITFEEFARELVAFVARMHGKGIFFRDLAGGNVLVDISRKPEITFSLIDTARIRSQPYAISERRMMADMKRLVLKLNPGQQCYLMNLYLGGQGKRYSLRYRLSFRLFAIKVYLKRVKRRIRRRLSS